jgi:myo-inositol catabolism protein IolC
MTAAGHPWFVLACDHRRPHLAALLDRDAEPGPADRPTIVAAKETIAAGLARAVAEGIDPHAAGLLVDEEYGADAARAAVAEGRIVVLPVEASGLDHFALADPGIVDRVLALDPTAVKALVRFNVDGDPAGNAASVAALLGLQRRLADHGTGLMLEVIVPPTPEQLAAAGDTDTFVRTARAPLLVRAVTRLLDAGLGPDLWKVEGIDRPDDAVAAADAARAGGRETGLVVLGAGAPLGRVDAWLRVAARTPGFVGFAVGRSLWWQEIRDLLAGRRDRDATVRAIATNFRHAVDVYTAA